MKNIILALALLPALAGANDGVAGVSAGGIVFRKTDAIAMKKEVLNVSVKLISVDYEFLNESTREVEETIVFPLPAYPLLGLPIDSYYGQPQGFSIRVDGKPVSFTTRLVALMGKKDVTAELKRIGLSEAQIAYNPQFQDHANPAVSVAIPALTAVQKQRLVKAGLFGERNDANGPLWSAQVNYVWKQRFPVNQIVRVHHEYRPFTDKAFGTAQFDVDLPADYCADKAFIAAYNKMVKRKGADGSFAVEKVGYILKTGNTWKNGIEDFTLNVTKGAPEELISLCFPGKFKKMNATTYQVRLQNFQPAKDLNIYFGDVATGSDDNSGVMPALTK